jgi:hypothetical protein
VFVEGKEGEFGFEGVVVEVVLPLAMVEGAYGGLKGGESMGRLFVDIVMVQVRRFDGK